MLQVAAWANMEKGQGPCGACMVVEDGVSAMLKTAEAIAVDFALPVPEELSFSLNNEPAYAVLPSYASRSLSPLDPPPDTLSA